MKNHIYRKKFTLTRAILEKIAELGYGMIDAFLPPQYGFTRPSRSLFGLDDYPQVSRRTISVILSRLVKQGLVTRTGSPKASRWKLTSAGRECLLKTLPDVPPPADGIARLVIFDIPERERRKRDVIRAELIGYRFNQLQKSVWIGFNPLPDEFVHLLDTLNLNNRVHIFSVKEEGTLKLSKKD